MNNRWTNPDGSRVTCDQGECVTPVYCSGLCRSHYNKAFRAGSLNPRITYEDADGNRLLCAVLDCNNEVLCRNMCGKHYKQLGRGVR